MKTDQADPLAARIRSLVDSIEWPIAFDRSRLQDASARFHREGREIIFRYHRKGDSGLRIARAGTLLMDLLIGKLFEAARLRERDRVETTEFPVSILSLGGYGRGEMSPFSDVDLMILLPNRREKQGERLYYESVTETILYPLWDLGLKVGHSTRSIRQAMEEAGKEMLSRNAFLEARLVAGDPGLEAEFHTAFQKVIGKRDLHADIQTQIQSRLERHRKYGLTPFIQAPDVKNGVGGMRDFQTVLWIARQRLSIGSTADLVARQLLAPGEKSNFLKAYDFLHRVRNELHFSSQRCIDTLDLERQPLVAWGLGYRQRDLLKRIEVFMRDYYSQVRIIYRISNFLEARFLQRDLPTRGEQLRFKTVLQAHRNRQPKAFDGFILRDNEIHASNPAVFEEDPDRMIRIFRHIQQHQARLSLDLERLIENQASRWVPFLHESEPAYRTFRSILQSAGEVHPILEKMHELGVLGTFIPEFGNLTCLVQHEYYHRYTADVHVLNTIAELDRIFRDELDDKKLYRKVLRDCDSPSLLYLALLLHDIGKANGVAGHDKRGAEMAVPVLQRMRIESPKSDQVVFLVRNHLEMARFWQRFDIDDPATIQSFAEFVEDPEQLRLLFVLTYCDSRGTCESLWSDYKQLLHERLFRATHERLTSDDTIKEQQMARKKSLEEAILQNPGGGLSREEIEAHFNLLPERYFAYHTENEIRLHLNMVHQLLAHIREADSLASLAPIIDWHSDRNQGLTIINVVTWDRPGLFYRLAGALSVTGLNILSTKAISRSDHIAIDTFYAVEPGGGASEEEAARTTFQEQVEKALIENTDLLPEIEKKSRSLRERFFRPTHGRLPIPHPPSVHVYHELSLKRTLVEIQSTDSLGLLYRLSRTISGHGYDIAFARISTENGIANDTFYIEPADEASGESDVRLVKLKEALLETAGT